MPAIFILAHGAAILQIWIVAITGGVVFLGLGLLVLARWLVTREKTLPQSVTPRGLHHLLVSSAAAVGVNFILSGIWLRTGYTPFPASADLGLAMLVGPGVAVGVMVFWILARRRAT